MLRRRLTFVLVLLITILAIVIDWPHTSVKFNLGSFKVDTVLQAPAIDLTGIGLPLRRDGELKLGLDLQGGTRLALQADMGPIATQDRDQALESAKNVIERRVNLFGVSEPVVQSAKVGDDYRVIVELPGIRDVNQAKDLVGRTAQLQFREYIDASASANQLPTLENTKETGVTGKDLQSARVDYPGASQGAPGQPVVAFSLTGEGTEKFAELTTRLVGQPLAIFLDDQTIGGAPPVVQTPITEGAGIISGGFDAAGARQLATQLNAGALPVSIQVVEERTIGASLGQESITKSMIAGAIGLLVVIFFMIAYYGFPGVLASAALILYTAYSLAVFKLWPITLTLAGIAGFILSIGMAVDANILIFERMREELRSGKNRHNSIEIGFARAWTSIRDSNISSLITAVILFWFGSGSVRGFALTLMIGILLSMFTAIILTKNLLRIFYHDRKPKSV